MKNRIKGFIATCLLGIMCFNITFNVKASEKSTLSEDEIVEVIQSMDGEFTVMPRKLYKSGDFDLGNENYFEVRFNTKNIGSDPHTRFDMEIRDVTGGSWYATITSDAGFYFKSEEYSGGANISVTNLKSDVTYTVTMYWAAPPVVHGKYTMWTSYQ
jgi:hypothetical protein